MAYRALVYFHRVPDMEPEYVGEIEFDLPPVIGKSVGFSHKGQRETGQIEKIAPPNWESLGVVPAVHIAKVGRHAAGF